MIMGVDLNHIAHARHTLAATVAVAACVSAAALLRLQQRPRQRLLLVRNGAAAAAHSSGRCDRMRDIVAADVVKYTVTQKYHT